MKKKDTTPYFCIDYQRLNEQAKDVDSSLPLIYKTLEDLSRVRVFLTLDLKSGYWQITLDEAKNCMAF